MNRLCVHNDNTECVKITELHCVDPLGHTNSKEYGY